MAKYENWFKDKERLNQLIDELNRVRNQMPSVHNDSIPIGESMEMWEAMNALERAIYFLKPLRKYKKPFPTTVNQP
jgi:hypothetical protein